MRFSLLFVFQHFLGFLFSDLFLIQLAEKRNIRNCCIWRLFNFKTSVDDIPSDNHNMPSVCLFDCFQCVALHLVLVPGSLYEAGTIFLPLLPQRRWSSLVTRSVSTQCRLCFWMLEIDLTGIMRRDGAMAEPEYPQRALSRRGCAASWQRSPWWSHPGCRSRRPETKIHDQCKSNDHLFGKYLVLENLLRHRVCPFHNWNVHVDDLELVWPANKMVKGGNTQIYIVHLLTCRGGSRMSRNSDKFL